MSDITLHFCLSTSRPAHITQTYDDAKTFIPADSNGPQGGLLVLKQSQLNADEQTSPSVRREAVSVFSSVIRTNPGHQSELSGCSPVVRHDSNGSSVCSSAFVHRGRQNQQRTAKEKVPRCSFKSKEVTLWCYFDSSGSDERLDEHQHDITEFNFTDVRRREEIVTPTSTKQQMSDDSSLSAQRADILGRIDEDRKHVRKEALFRITDEFKLNVYFLFRLN